MVYIPVTLRRILEKKQKVAVTYLIFFSQKKMCSNHIKVSFTCMDFCLNWQKKSTIHAKLCMTQLSFPRVVYMQFVPHIQIKVLKLDFLIFPLEVCFFFTYISHSRYNISTCKTRWKIVFDSVCSCSVTIRRKKICKITLFIKSL